MNEMPEKSIIHKSNEWCRYLREKKGLVSTMPSEARNFNTIAEHITRLLATLTAANERAERAEEELSIWKSVFPDIAPDSVLPDRSTLEAENAGLSARVARLEADNIRLISQLVSANIVIIAAENEHRANHNKA